MDAHITNQIRITTRYPIPVADEYRAIGHAYYAYAGHLHFSSGILLDLRLI